MDDVLKTAKDAAIIAGNILMKEFGKLQEHQIGLKGMGDYVTEMDRRSENAIIKRIKRDFPDHHVHAEESGAECLESPFHWIIDPLDGTTNYVQSIPLFSISIGVLEENRIIAGVVYDPLRKEMFWTQKGKGAFLNGLRIRVSSKPDMASAALASGFPWRSKQYIDAYLASFKALIIKVSAIRRMGSAAVDLAYTACGRFDGFWEMKLKPWDIAAGILLMREAGGVVTDFRGEDGFMTSGNVLAGSPAIHAGMLEVTRLHLAEID